jgi:hypothetical protein
MLTSTYVCYEENKIYEKNIQTVSDDEFYATDYLHLYTGRSHQGCIPDKHRTN